MTVDLWYDTCQVYELRYPAGRIYACEFVTDSTMSSLRIPQSCRMNFSHNGSWHSAFAIRHFMIHRRMLFLRWQFSGTDSILNLGASGLQLTCTTLQLHQSTNTYYSCSKLSTTAGLLLLPGNIFYIFYLCWTISAGTGLKSPQNDEPILLKSQDDPCLNWIHLYK